VLFRDVLAARYIEPVWVRGPLRGKYKGCELIIIPAFNELRGHTLVNKDKLIGPIAKCLNKKRARVFLLDGTDLGNVEDLKIKED
jgi:metallophosphoesterase superfamily enzyme